MENEEGYIQAQVKQQPSSGDCTLRVAANSISSLISFSHSIRVFPSKWQIIRNKLEELHSGFVDVENYVSRENKSLSALLPTVLVTVDECYDLARRCVDVLCSGKLLMQSDLNVILTKLDRHVRKLSEIYTAGILTDNCALVVSRPSPGASKDDMLFYIKDLLTRMRIGDLDMKRQALVNLLEVATEDEKYVRVIVEVSDIVNVLVHFLDSQEMENQADSAKLISLIAGFDCYKGMLIGAGVIAPLIRVLECGSGHGKEEAAKCLSKLTENADNAWSVSAHGGVTSLLNICAIDDCKGELIGPACGILRNLVGVEEIKRFMVDEGAISTFIKLLRSKEETVQINSMQLLQRIASEDGFVKQMVIREGGVPALLNILDPRWLHSSKAREIAISSIENLCFSSNTSITILMNCGFVDQLLYYIRYGEVSFQELALKVAARLCGISEEAKKAMGEAGIMEEIMKFLNTKSFEAREMAFEALYVMVLVPKNRKKFLQDDRNIGLLLQLLDSEEGISGNKKVLISILLSLTNCNSGRKKIVNSGYIKHIEKLAEAEVYNAKRLVRKLSTNRFRNMLTGIWH